jgi:hypothetical protein
MAHSPAIRAGETPFLENRSLMALQHQACDELSAAVRQAVAVLPAAMPCTPAS